MATSDRVRSDAKSGSKPFELSSHDMSSGGQMILKTFDALPSFVSAEDMLKARFGDFEGDSLDQFGVEDISEIVLKPAIIDLDKLQREYYQSTNSVTLYYNWLRSQQMMKTMGSKNTSGFKVESRIQPGVVVVGTLNPNQSGAVELNEGEIYTASEIFKKVPTVFIGYKDICDTLFGSNFYVVLTKTQFKNAKSKAGASLSTKKGKSGKTKSDGDESDAIHFPNLNAGEKSAEEGVKKKIGDQFKTLLDLPDQIVMDEIVQSVMNDYWLPFFKIAEELRLKLGIVPFYFRQIVVSVPVYVMSDEDDGDEDNEDTSEGAMTPSRDNSDEEFDDGEDVDDDIYDDVARNMVVDDSMLGRNHSKLQQRAAKKFRIDDNSGGEDIVSWLKKVSDETVSYAGSSLAKMLKIPESDVIDQRIAEIYKYKGYTPPRVSGINSFIRDKVELKDYELDEVLRSNSAENIGMSPVANEIKYKYSKMLINNLDFDTRDELQQLLTSMEADRLTFVAEIQVMLTKLEQLNASRTTLDDHGLSEDYDIGRELEEFERGVSEYIEKWSARLIAFERRSGVNVGQSVSRISIPEGLTSIKIKYDQNNANDTVVKLGGLEEFKTPQSKDIGGRKRKGARRQDADGVKRRKISEGEYVREGSTIGNETRRQKKEKIIERPRFGRITPDWKHIVEDTDNLVVKKYLNVTHHVPTIAPLDSGVIRTYFDGKCQRYMWSWNANDRYTGDLLGGKLQQSSATAIENMEPFMHFFVYEHCSFYGSLQSPLSRMIPLYTEYNTLLTKIDRETKSGRMDLFVIEKEPPKVDKHDPAYMSGGNYNPTFADLSGPNKKDGTGGGAAAGSHTDTGFDTLFLGNDPGMYNSSILLSDTSEPLQGGSGGSTESTAPSAEALKRYKHHMFQNPYQCIDLSTNSSAHGDNMTSKRHHEKMMASERDTYARVNAKNQISSRLASTALNREVSLTPFGFFINSKPGEKIKKISDNHDTDVSRLKELRVGLDELGGVISGYPMTNLLNREGKGMSKQSDSGYNTKNDIRSTSSTGAGFFVHQENRNPTQELRATNRDSLVMVYSNMAANIFKIAYGNLLNVNENWYKRLVSQTFETSKTGKNDLPDIASLFKVVVTFPPANSANMNEVLSMYNLGAMDHRDVALCMINLRKKITGNIPNNFLTMYSNSADQDFETIENRIKENLPLLRQLDLEKQYPTPPANASDASSTKVKKSGTKSKASQSEKKEKKKTDKPSPKPAKTKDKTTETSKTREKVDSDKSGADSSDAKSKKASPDQSK